jgi:hypothetical protein
VRALVAMGGWMLAAGSIAMPIVAPGATAAPCATPLLYPGDSAPAAAIAQWMADGAQRRDIPSELPVMAALVESGLRNLNYGDSDAVGYFQMRVGIWNSGPYAGFPDHPELQLRWFLDQATAVRTQHRAAGDTSFGESPSQYGDWIADVERPPEQLRFRYQLRLDEARALIGNGGCPGTAPAPPAPPVPPAPPPPPTLMSLSPTRVLDTRAAIGYQGPKPAPGATIALPLAGRAGLPSAGVGAVVLNLTATEATDPGFVTVWPTGTARPTASSLNLERSGQTRPNLVVAALGVGGAVSIYTQSGTHLVADLLAWFPAGGGLHAESPVRILDTRPGGQVGYSGPKPAAAAHLDVSVAGVPDVGVSAVIFNLTITEADGPGYVTAWPSGAVPPPISNVNVSGAGETNQNLVIVPVGSGGRVSLSTFAGAHLVADLVGWLDAGYQPSGPSRVMDTRAASGSAGAGQRLGPGGTAALALAGAAGATAVVNVTADDATAPGYVTVWPSGRPQPDTSNLNQERAHQTVANLVIVPVGPDGTVRLFSLSGTDLVVDDIGRFG